MFETLPVRHLSRTLLQARFLPDPLTEINTKAQQCVGCLSWDAACKRGEDWGCKGHVQGLDLRLAAEAKSTKAASSITSSHEQLDKSLQQVQLIIGSIDNQTTHLRTLFSSWEQQKSPLNEVARHLPISS